MISIKKLRENIRKGIFRESTAGLANDLIQANVMIIPKRFSLHFLKWCIANPVACPVIDFLLPGQYTDNHYLKDLDIRFDVPEYQVWTNNSRSTVFSIENLWSPSLVSVLLGCSYNLDATLLEHGIVGHHVEEGKRVPMFISKLQTKTVPPFKGPVVVSMRAIKNSMVNKVLALSTLDIYSHGAPLYYGHDYSAKLGISNINNPDFGEPIPIHEDEVPFFWACGVTSQMAVANANLEMAISHSPGKMLITNGILQETMFKI